MHRFRWPRGQVYDAGYLPDGAKLECHIHATSGQGDEHGFLQEHLCAYSEGQRVGYLRVRYVTEESVDKAFPTLLHYIDRACGPSILPSGLTANPFTMSGPDLVPVLDHVANRNREIAAFLKSVGRGTPDGPAFERYFHTTELAARARQRLHHFKLNFSTPVVDWITTRESEKYGIRADNSGRGIATVMYAAMVESLRPKGLQLRASTSQRPRAASIWARFQELGWATRRPLILSPEELAEGYSVSGDKLMLDGDIIGPALLELVIDPAQMPDPAKVLEEFRLKGPKL